MRSRNRWYVNIVVILGIIAVLSKGNEAGVCEICVKDFTVLGRHQYRCKARTFTTVTIDHIPKGSDTFSTPTRPNSANNRVIENETSSLVHLYDSDYNGETAANNEPVVEPEQNNHDHQCYCGKSFTLLFVIPRTVLLVFIQPEAETSTSRPTHFREILRKSFHHMNTNKGGIVKQSGNDVEGYRSQKVLFQPSVLVFLQ